MIHGGIDGIERMGIGSELIPVAAPIPMVQEDLASGRLVKLNIPEYESGNYTFDVIYRTDVPPAPAARWLIERFVQQRSE